ncbi:MAG TPA: hypothetical protein VGW98_05685 [Solirubrobacteraceae bacterium]|jgi:hypothetical protein|nr:hypothetical protein [Solirubrobacteraceae bacterium]
MPSLIASAAAVCLCSLLLGQAVLALCGAKRWHWIAAPVGFAALIVLAVPAIHVPGRSVTVVIVIAALSLGGLALWIRRPLHRPRVSDLLAALPVVIMVLVPFAASGRAGTLGVSFDNDMGAHLLLAEAYRSAAVAKVSPLLPAYPLGPHAVAAAVAEGLNVRIDIAFAGLSAAIPVLLAWTALACVQKANWFARLFVATVVGIPFLIAAYYGQGAFKETMEALFVLAAALIIAGLQPVLDRRRWIPLAFVLAGAVSVYSLQGVVWPVAFIAIWIAVRVGRDILRSGPRSAWRSQREELLPGAVGFGVTVALLIPQIPRVERFVATGASINIAKTNLGNLIGPLPAWEAFGAWNQPDLRLPAAPAFTAGMWTAFILALVLIGGVTLLKTSYWMLPLAAVASMLVWGYANHAQSPYVAAKALVIASPLLLVLAALAVVGTPLTRRSWLAMAAPLLALLLLGRIVVSSWEALRYSKIGPTRHLAELRSLAHVIGTQPTLYLGNDDFIRWELAGANVTPAYFAGIPGVPLRPEKAFTYGEPLDFDTVNSQAFNGFDWVITPKDAAGSQAPEQMRLARVTSSYDLWQRVSVVPTRSVLAEGPNASAPLDCSSAAGRVIVRARGVAAVRAPEPVVAVPPIAPGATVTVTLQLTPGTWLLETPYVSPLPLSVTSHGLRSTLPANLERPGPRWPIGQINVVRAGPVPITLRTTKYWLTPSSDVATPEAVVATPAAADQILPLRAACGKLVDWYRAG